ncbi:MAG: phosphoribosylaminoimidazolesuccinocarboxamide synthase [Chitinophagales bacterium]|nr:phosphoribosylaminoimidazolesuccinocarboxamide synthase [Chitinophagales bacterium]
MEKGKMIYEGKAKQMFETENRNEIIVRFKDDATAFNAQKRGSFKLKGEMNNAITSLIYDYLGKKGINTHFIQKLNEREQLVKKVTIFPIEVVVRNYSAGSMAQRLGIEEGIKSPVTIFDLCYKNDALNDPLINDYHVLFLGLATQEELEEIYQLAEDINILLIDLFDKMNLRLVDFKIELGKTTDGKIVLADEISPDTCRLWDKDTLKKLDKDRFRRDLGEITEAYVEVYKRLLKALN